MSLTVKETVLPGVLKVSLSCFRDDRGFFMETYNRRAFHDAGIAVDFVQDNHSRSSLNVLRGLHFQTSIAPMAKLVRCTRGVVRDVAVDLRLGQSTFGNWVAVELSEENMTLLFIPVGFAHGFVSLSECAEIQYKCSGYYAPSAERTIRWDDPDLGITWGVASPFVSAKDQAGISLADYRASLDFR